MDLGFARRKRGQLARPDAPKELARLLADISARQSVSPTAQAQMHANATPEAPGASSCEIAPFAPIAAQPLPGDRPASFNREIAETIIEQRKSL